MNTEKNIKNVKLMAQKLNIPASKISSTISHAVYAAIGDDQDQLNRNSDKKQRNKSMPIITTNPNGQVQISFPNIDTNITYDFTKNQATINKPCGLSEQGFTSTNQILLIPSINDLTKNPNELTTIIKQPIQIAKAEQQIYQTLAQIDPDFYPNNENGNIIGKESNPQQYDTLLTIHNTITQDPNDETTPLQRAQQLAQHMTTLNQLIQEEHNDQIQYPNKQQYTNTQRAQLQKRVKGKDNAKQNNQQEISVADGKLNMNNAYTLALFKPFTNTKKEHGNQDIDITKLKKYIDTLQTTKSKRDEKISFASNNEQYQIPGTRTHEQSMSLAA